MEPDFQEILNLDDIKGVMVLSPEGQLLFQKMTSPELSSIRAEIKDWTPFLKALQGVREADFIFEHYRLYLRESAGGYLLILMGHFAPIAMVRLHCDILLPSLKQVHASKGLGRFFKRKK